MLSSEKQEIENEYFTCQSKRLFSPSSKSKRLPEQNDWFPTNFSNFLQNKSSLTEAE